MSASIPAQNNDLRSHSLAYQTYTKHDDDEKNHFEDVCQSFRQYAAFAMSQWANHQYRLHSLPESQRAVLPNALKRDTADFNRKASQYKEAAIRNQFCLDCILRHAGKPHSQQNTTMLTAVTDEQISKVSSVLKSLARDWSSEGKLERDIAYKPLISQLKKYLPIDDCAVSRPTVCVPGAGKNFDLLPHCILWLVRS
jgi:carnosine N-methyltransferase